MSNNPRPSPNAIRLLARWARASLGQFARLSLEQPGPACRALADVEPLAAAFGMPKNALDDVPWQKWFALGAERLSGDDGALGRLAAGLRATPVDLLLLGLCAAVESDHTTGLALAELQGGDVRPTLHLAASLVEALFPSVSLTPAALACAPLIEAQVISLVGEGPLPQLTLVVDPRLVAAIEVPGRPWPGCRFLLPAQPGDLPAAAEAQIEPLAALLASGRARVCLLRGLPRTGRGRLAATIAARLGLRALEIPQNVWCNKSLGSACVAARWLPVLQPRVGAGETISIASDAGYQGPLIAIMGRDGGLEDAGVVEAEVPVASQSERTRCWLDACGDATLAETLAPAVLSRPVIESLADAASMVAAQRGGRVEPDDVAKARRHLAADALGNLAQPVDRQVPRAALVLAPAVGRQLDDLVVRCRRREALWQALGVTLACTQNLGVRALFVGESGTGKTLAASYVATALGAPLYRVDLSAVMNKYVGESEKNLGRVLDLAAAHDIVLLFDEADALFGQRTDANETGERYANMLTNFLLTRVENHPGIVLLTSNSRLRIDAAFNRRLDVIVEFPMPGPSERADLWRSHLGDRNPGQDICATLGNHCELPGGHIRNVVLAAAARSSEGPISVPVLLEELGREYRKLGRPVPARLAAET
jgi:hypothetical protein